MYYPYIRGKQYELITLRETSTLLASSGFIPIIEPVKEALNGLSRSLKAIGDANGEAIVIINPYHGDHAEDGTNINELLESEFQNSRSVKKGILLKEGTTINEAQSLYQKLGSENVTFIHAGFTEGKSLKEFIGSAPNNVQHVFISDYCTRPYIKHFDANKKILVKDGFKRQKNADYPELESFSDIHLTYDDDGFNGFGDFLIVGDQYSESGGPAYAVAIHVTFIDPEKDDVMYVHHFVSDTKDTPTDVAGKFGEALQKLINTLDSSQNKIKETSAITEFRELHKKQHFPGLGYVKKLSMKHHIETIADYMANS